MDQAGEALQPLGIGPAADVVRRIERSIDASPPGFPRLSERGKFKFERLPIGVDDKVQEERITEQADGTREGVRFVRPIRARSI